MDQSPPSNDTPDTPQTLEELLNTGTSAISKLPGLSVLGNQLFMFGAESMMLRLHEVGIEAASIELKDLSEKTLPSE